MLYHERSNNNYIFVVARSNNDYILLCCIMREQTTNNTNIARCKELWYDDETQQSNFHKLSITRMTATTVFLLCCIARSNNDMLIFVMLQETTSTMVDCNEGMRECTKQQQTKFLHCIAGARNDCKTTTSSTQ
jgi:hypothetical protein